MFLKNNQKGFSIIELFIAVGIIGIITSIAVPSYRKYMRNSKSAEAQSSLGQVYMGEKTFFLQWRFYTVDLGLINIQPEGELLYNVGFSGSGIDPFPPSYRGPCPDPTATGCFQRDSRNNFFKICGMDFDDDQPAGGVNSCAFTNKAVRKNGDTGFTPPDIPADDGNGTAYDADATTFKAAAVGDIINRLPKNDADKKDIWSINHNKQVIREKDGT